MSEHFDYTDASNMIVEFEWNGHKKRLIQTSVNAIDVQTFIHGGWIGTGHYMEHQLDEYIIMLLFTKLAAALIAAKEQSCQK